MQSYNEARKNIKKKKTNIKSDSKKFEGVGSTYEAAQKVSQPKKKVVKKKETVTTTKSLPPKKRTKKPFGLGPDDKAYGALPKKKRTAKPFGPGAEDLERAAKVRAIRKPTVDVTKLPPKKRTAQPFGPGAEDVKRSSTIRKGEPKVTKKRLSDPSYNPMGIKGARLARDKRKDARRSKETEVMRLKAAEYGKPDVLYDKTGGKVSRKKGGTVSRNTGGWLGGNSEVSKWYD